MPIYLNTKGQPTLGVALCYRCQRKRMLGDLIEDGFIPRFYVCRDNPGCYDQPDPMRQPPRQPDDLRLPFVRPDVDLTVPPSDAAQLPLQPPEQED
ncbi:MAG: hypothetical protein ACOY4R_27800 [Pseudomonadota bacterium]